MVGLRRPFNGRGEVKDILAVVPADSVLETSPGSQQYRGVKARVLSNGRIQLLPDQLESLAMRHLEGETFDSVSGAATAIRGGSPTNGWVFWRFEGTPLTDCSSLTPPRDSTVVAMPSGVEPELARERSEWVDKEMNKFIESVARSYRREIPRYENLIREVRREVSSVLGDYGLAGVTDRVKSVESLQGKLRNRWSAIARRRNIEDPERTTTDDPERTTTDDPKRITTESVLHRVKGLLQDAFDAALVAEPQDAIVIESGDSRSPGYVMQIDSGQVLDSSLQQQVLDSVPDLAGIRVLVYREKDLEGIVADFRSQWESKDTTNFALDEPIRTSEHFRKESGSGRYQANHLRLRYYAPGLETSERDLQLDGARCEVQVALMSHHLINEVGHAVSYKVPTKPDSETKSKVADRLSGLQEDDMAAIDKKLERLFTLVGVLPRRSGAGNIDTTDESAADALLLPDRVLGEPAGTAGERKRRELVRKWLEGLLVFANEAPTSDDVIEARTVLDHVQPRPTRVFADSYNASADENIQLDRHSPFDKWLLAALHDLPKRFLERFAQANGRVDASRGRPALVVQMAEAAARVRPG